MTLSVFHRGIYVIDMIISLQLKKYLILDVVPNIDNVKELKMRDNWDLDE